MFLFLGLFYWFPLSTSHNRTMNVIMQVRAAAGLGLLLGGALMLTIALLEEQLWPLVSDDWGGLVERHPGCPAFPPARGMEAGHRASRINRILINRTHPQAMTTTVVLAPKQHRKRGCGWRRAQSRQGEGGPGGCRTLGSGLRGRALCFSPERKGRVGSERCTKVPIAAV